MNKKLLHKILCGSLAVIGIASFIIAICIPPLIPVFVPLGVVCGGGAVGMFQSVFAASSPSEADDNESVPEMVEAARSRTTSISHEEDGNVTNMFFQFNVGTGNEREGNVPETRSPGTRLQLV